MKRKGSGHKWFFLIFAMVTLCGALVFAFWWFKPYTPAPDRSPEVRPVTRHKIPVLPPEPVRKEIAKTDPVESSQPAMDYARGQDNGQTSTNLPLTVKNSPTPPPDEPTSMPAASEQDQPGQGNPETQVAPGDRSSENPVSPPQVDASGPESGVETAAAPEAPAGSFPPTVAVPEQPAPEPQKAARFTIQVGAFREKAYAQQSRIQWQARGYDAYILEVGDASGRRWYFVRFGRFDTHEDAGSFLVEFQNKEKASAMITSYKKP